MNLFLSCMFLIGTPISGSFESSVEIKCNF